MRNAIWEVWGTYLLHSIIYFHSPKLKVSQLFLNKTNFEFILIAI